MEVTEAIALLRRMDVRLLDAVLREARICDGWVFYDDDGAIVNDDDEDFDQRCCAGYLGLLGRLDTRAGNIREDVYAARTEVRWSWRLEDPNLDPNPHGVCATRAEAEEALELAAVAAGYRLPWRKS